MDGNKVQSLRQQFEVLSQYANDSATVVGNEKADSKFYTSSSFKSVESTNVNFHQKPIKTSTLNNGEADEVFFCQTKNSTGRTSYSSIEDNQGNVLHNDGNELIKPGVSGDGLFVSGNRRNGIYVSNYMTLYADTPLMQRELIYSQPQQPQIHSPPHPDPSYRNTSTKAKVEQCYSHSNNNNNNGSINSHSNLDSNNEDANMQQHSLIHDLYNTHISNYEALSNTQQSSASNSTCSTSGVYGRVKRSNAFRKKDFIESTDIRVGKKVVLDRVKSLDASTTNSTTSMATASGKSDESFNDRSAQRTASVCLRPNQSKKSLIHKTARPVTIHQDLTGITSDVIMNSNSMSIKDKSAASMFSPQTCAIDQPKPSRSGIQLTPSPCQQSRSHPHLSSHPPCNGPGVIMADAQYGTLICSQDSSLPHPDIYNNQLTVAKGIPQQLPPLSKGLPPEKPPRTFLYDILSDSQANKSNQAIGPGTNVKDNKSLSNSGIQTTTTINPSTPKRLSTSTKFHSHQSSKSVANNNGGNNISKNGNLAHSSSNDEVYVFAAANVQKTINSAKLIHNSNKKIDSEISKQSNNNFDSYKMHSRNSTPSINANTGMPLLIRSKTESQIITRNKAKPRQSAIDMEMINSSMKTRGNYFQSSECIGQENPAFLFDSCHMTAAIQKTDPRPVEIATRAETTNVKNAQFSNPNMHNRHSAIGLSEWAAYSCERNPLLLHEYNDPSHSYGDKNKDFKSNNNIMSQSPIDDTLSTKTEWVLNDGTQFGKKIRRNTVVNVPSHTAGYPSLDSNISTNSFTSSQASCSGSNPNSKIFKSGIQHSIQNLMSQLFPAPVTSIKDATSSTDSGIQIGSDSLSSCDTPMGDSTTDTGDSDCENDMEISNISRQVVEARKGYIRRVSSIRLQELGASLHRMIQNSKKPVHNEEPLFECIIVVGLNRDAYNGTYHPYIKEIYPPNIKLADGVEQFCFPDSLEWPCHEGISAQFYTLAITDQRGSRKYGCCYRILPEGATICIPITYCLISSHRAIGFYKEVLREITSRHGLSEFQKRFWMEELHKRPFPNPGDSITVQEPVVEEIYHEGAIQYYKNLTVSPKTVTLRRRADHRLDESDLVTLLSTVDLPIVIKLFGSLLLERKVVVISRALSNLSLCVEALESLLYPFTWQHTFVPILPLSMTDVLDAPAPFLIGVLRSSQTPWDKTLDEGIVVDLDGNKVLSCVGDEATILPKRVNRKLRDALQLVLNLADQKESTKNVLISECFIRMFVETLGHFSSHFVPQDGLKAFNRETFTKQCDSKATQNFLEWFSETSMFHEFLELRIKGAHKYGIFEQRIMEQSEQSNSPNVSTLSLKNAKLFMKGSKPFGNWLKEAFVMK